MDNQILIILRTKVSLISCRKCPVSGRYGYPWKYFTFVHRSGISFRATPSSQSLTGIRPGQTTKNRDNDDKSTRISYKLNQSQLLSGIDSNRSQPKSGNDKVAKMSPKIEIQKELATENQQVSSFWGASDGNTKVYNQTTFLLKLYWNISVSLCLSVAD